LRSAGALTDDQDARLRSDFESQIDACVERAERAEVATLADAKASTYAN